ncbi:lipid-A-disaccharide synthase [Dasania sp. GY-MA-18]|uniref:Lipid-A-disaccharide synthase n=1 Tax=Dasania phycosphaerae TaxID=2950436 RepID=A0A9J6RQK5_9GAMM|nr:MULTISPECIES: lipid-A-disaccharide synthase [Dasania]MCR8923981.1 lipid-A-disaccharide synthase [Dasania sp. GY-MA-18]MCZ0866415.1 lipid-A-disaccharide synthase [Dasania phycosphaerae]MCZ0870139.1 lipid-A-disaccharide synthase [Dasania phycosphaerae]
MAESLRIGIVVGEASGDILGASLIKAIKQQYPQAQFEGIGGPLMLAQGFNSHHPMERLAVMGIVEPLKRLPELLRIRRSLKEHFIAKPPDLFLGIDSPDFNLDLELALRKAGLLTAHYVSPSVWAWRSGRVHKIAKAVDRMLTLFPFEAQFYHQHNVPVSFIGHPLADKFPLQNDQQQAQQALGLSADKPLVALLPGSRGGEVAMLGEAFIETARWCLHQRSDLQFILPAANEARYQQLQTLLSQRGAGLPITLIQGDSQTAMAAADAVLMASGTTTLEAMLLKRPMVVAYKMAGLSYAIISRMVKSKYIALPNLLAGEMLVPEVLQQDVRPEMLGPLVLDALQNKAKRAALIERFTEIHQTLKMNASERAAEVLLKMIRHRHNESHDAQS